MLTVLPPLFWLLLAGGALGLLGIAWLRRLRWLPAWFLRAGLLGVALLAAFFPERQGVVDAPPPRTVLVVDQSDSIAPDERVAARLSAQAWQTGGPNRLVVAFGAGASAAAGAEFPAVGGAASDLAAALALAAELLEDGPGRVIVATDGRPDDPLAAARALERLAGRQVAWIPLQTNAFPADVFTGALYLPSAMWENSPFTALLPVYVALPGDVTLRVSVNEQQVIEETLNLPAGAHLIPFNLQTTVSEILTVAAQVESAGDPRPENNSAYAALQVFPAPRLLVVTEDAGTAGNFASALSRVGLDADLTSPEDLPDSLERLSLYQVILVDNILATRLREAQMRALKDFVQQLGRGLIFTGGRNAFTLGGYRDTLLEPVLPVRLEPPPREQNSPLTLVLVLDRSASMDGARGTPPQQRPIALAREAALRSVETLGPEDFLGILSYNSSAVWSLPIQQAGAGDVLQSAKDAMAALTPSGGTAIYNALSAAVTGLLETPTSETRHIVLLSDGNDETPLADYVALAESAREQGITLSTIALGVEADQELMALLAEAGQGRFYPVLNAADLPQILIDESQAARDENIHEGAVAPVVGEANHPILSGLDVAAMPALLGYNALESKADEGAEDVLLSAGFEDPLLSVWQVGLGRVAAWTGDLGREWGPDWAGWPEWGRFWSNVIRYTLPDPALGPGQVDVAVGAESVTVTARVLNGAGVPRSGVAVTFSLATPSGEVRTYPVPQIAPGLYELALPRPSEGAYRAVVAFPDEEGFPVETAAALAVNYPREWQPPTGDERFPFSEVTSWSALAAEDEPAEAVRLAPAEALTRLLAALVLLWPLEIAVRRRLLPWR